MLAQDIWFIHIIETNNIFRSRKYKVSVGTDNIQGGYLYDIEKIIVHENYNSTTYDYDVCVIKLNGTLEYSDTVNKIELAEITPPSGLLVKVSGWGKTVSSSIVFALQTYSKLADSLSLRQYL